MTVTAAFAKSPTSCLGQHQIDAGVDEFFEGQVLDPGVVGAKCLKPLLLIENTTAQVAVLRAASEQLIEDAPEPAVIGQVGRMKPNAPHDNTTPSCASMANRYLASSWAV